MTNHVHLLVTPDAAGGVSRMMQAIGRRYVGAFNARYRRTGTLWEGRFKSALVDSDGYLLTCYRYIELNPGPGRHGPGSCPLPVDQPSAERLWRTRPMHHPTPRPPDPSARKVAYRALFREATDEGAADELRDHTRQNKALGNDRFRKQIEALAGRSLEVRPRGRPRSAAEK